MRCEVRSTPSEYQYTGGKEPKNEGARWDSSVNEWPETGRGGMLHDVEFMYIVTSHEAQRYSSSSKRDSKGVMLALANNRLS